MIKKNIYRGFLFLIVSFLLFSCNQKIINTAATMKVPNESIISSTFVLPSETATKIVLNTPIHEVINLDENKIIYPQNNLYINELVKRLSDNPEKYPLASISDTLSPNAKWISHLGKPNNGKDSLFFSSVDGNSDLVGKIPSSTDLKYYLPFGLWTPDSTAYVIKAQKIQGMYKADGIVIFNIENNQLIKAYSYMLPEGLDSEIYLRWSPDGNKLLVCYYKLVDPSDITKVNYYFITLDRQANKINEFIAPGSHIIDPDVRWMNQGIYLISSSNGIKKGSQLWKIDQDNPENGKLIYTNENESLHLISVAPNEKQALLVSNSNENNLNRLLIVDIIDGSVKKTIDVPGQIREFYLSDDNEFIGMYLGGSAFAKDHLAFFNWKYGIVNDYGLISYLIVGWRNNVNGLVVLNLDKNFQITSGGVIKP
jgi:hypothetical protein